MTERDLLLRIAKLKGYRWYDNGRAGGPAQRDTVAQLGAQVLELDRGHGGTLSPGGRHGRSSRGIGLASWLLGMTLGRTANCGRSDL